MMSTKNTKQLAVYASCAGIPYLVFGLLELARGLSEAFEVTWEVSTMLVYPDMFSGVTLAIIGVVFLFGVWTKRKTSKDTASYLAVGALLATVFFAVYLAILGAHALGAAIYHISSAPYADIFADWAEWTWTDDMRAGIWMYLFALPAVYYTVKMWMTRKNKP